jgi:hypothetical protein
MRNLRSPWSLFAGVAAGFMLAVLGGVAFAAPSYNSDLAGAPPSTPEQQSAALAITVRTCPAGYDPTATTADFKRDCHEPAGDTNFILDQAGATGGGPSASTGTSGDAPQESTVRFSGMAAGRYTVTAEAPPEIAGAFVGACTSDKRSFEGYPFVPFALVGADGKVTLDLQSGESLACDWYQVAAPKPGT